MYGYISPRANKTEAAETSNPNNAAMLVNALPQAPIKQVVQPQPKPQSKCGSGGCGSGKCKS